MNNCPYCGEAIDTKDILFFGARDSAGGRTNTVRPAGPVARGRTDSMRSGGSRFERTRPAAPVAGQTQEAPVVQASAEEFLSRWGRDEMYEEFRAKFWKAENSHPQERYIVHWTEDAPSPGYAQIERPVPGTSIPASVTLCEEDRQKYNLNNETIFTRSMCPKCHCEIPTKFLAIPDERCHSIVLMGYPSCGKTAFKIAVLQEIMSLTNRYDLCDKVEILADSKRFLEGEAGGFADGNADATQRGATVFPMIFTLEKDNVRNLIVMYDMPGEAFKSENVSALLNHKGLKNVDAGILMVDAAQLYEDIDKENVVVLSTDTEGKSTSVQQAVQYVARQTSILAPLQEAYDNSLFEKMNLMSLVITKADMLIRSGNRAVFNQKNLTLYKSDESADHAGAVSARVITQIDQQVMKAIIESPNYSNRRRGLKSDIVRLIPGDTLKTENIRAFAISTLRRREGNEFVVADQMTITRHRILEPLLYLFAKWDAVRVDKTQNWGQGSDPFNIKTVGVDPGEGGEVPADPPEKKGLFGRLFTRK